MLPHLHVDASVSAVKAQTPAPDERRAPGRRAAGLRIAEAKREGAISDVTAADDAPAL